MPNVAKHNRASMRWRTLSASTECVGASAHSPAVTSNKWKVPPIGFADADSSASRADRPQLWIHITHASMRNVEPVQVDGETVVRDGHIDGPDSLAKRAHAKAVFDA